VSKSLSALARECLVRGIQAVVKAVKLKIADGIVPQNRQLLPPKETDGDDCDARTLPRCLASPRLLKVILRPGCESKGRDRRSGYR
jgi:hypothetical protein